MLYGIAFSLRLIVGLLEDLLLLRQGHVTMHPLSYISFSLSLSLLFTSHEGFPFIHANFNNTLMLWQGFLLKSNVLTIVGSLIGFSGRGAFRVGGYRWGKGEQ